jgi:hypothetical protein
MAPLPSRDVFLWAALVCFGLDVLFGIVGVNQRVHLVTVGLALATLAWLRGAG